MSLDVYLHLPGSQCQVEPGRIFIRDDGATRAISRDEWDRRFPGREPVTMTQEEPTDLVYQANITHNLSGMADEAGLYEPLWHPEALGFTTAQQLITPLRTGLQVLQADPARFQSLNPPNGWGTYEGLVQFVAAYLAACEQYPEATVSVWV
jgi:hypothetical protein